MSRAPLETDAPRAVDVAFAALLQRLDPATDARVLQAAQRAMQAVAQGHAALDLRDPALLADTGGDVEALRAALRASRWVDDRSSDPGVSMLEAPLVLADMLLYLRRYYEYERRLAAGLRRIAAQSVETGDLDALAPLFAQLFPQTSDVRGGKNPSPLVGEGQARSARERGRHRDDQARAAALALVRNLLLITGGPGTGKTTTLARLLVLLIARHRLSSPFEKEGSRGICAAPLRIALAAPTGRAAERMAQSIAQARDALRKAGVDEALLDALPLQARTLHRLLGPIPDRPRFRHDAAHPLSFDVVVVDEASMVDLPLMCKLVEAVPDGAALILVGDPDQLPSVEAGDVLAAIVQAAGDAVAWPPDIETALSTLLGAPATGDLFAARSDAPLAGHRVHLRRGWRQSSALDLAPLADAVRAGDGDRALALLHAQSLRGVHFHAGLADPLAGATREALLTPWRALAQLDDPREALAHAARMRLLTAVRNGPQGASRLNARIEEALAGAQRTRYFHGRLLLVTENSYRHGLFNGDIGICLRDDAGAVVAWFPGHDPHDTRAFHPAALPAHESAFAMTVHKAQGSEFDAVWLLLPARDNRVLSRELVYTAITRARRELHVAGSADVIADALGRHASRWSGLGRRLGSSAESAL